MNEKRLERKQKPLYFLSVPGSFWRVSRPQQFIIVPVKQKQLSVEITFIGTLHSRHSLAILIYIKKINISKLISSDNVVVMTMTNFDDLTSSIIIVFNTYWLRVKMFT